MGAGEDVETMRGRTDMTTEGEDIFMMRKRVGKRKWRGDCSKEDELH
jgi:hypothetical protein